MDASSMDAWCRVAALASLLVCMVGTGCSESDRARGSGLPAATDSASPSAEPRPSAGPTAEPPEQRPSVRRDTVFIEGMPETITLRLYEAPQDFTLPFSTYLPEEMAAERTERDEVAFFAEFGGRRNEDAALRVAIHPAGATAGQARERLREVAERFGRPVADGSAGEPWVLHAYRLRGPLYGRALLGRHDGRYFHVLMHYPGEYADGFAPRTARILTEWRWTDTGEPLQPR